MKFLHLVWSNLKRRKLRTLLTLLSIIVAFVLFGLLSAIKQALVGGVNFTGADRLVVQHRVSIIQLLPRSYQQRIRAIPSVSGTTHYSWFGGVYQDGRHFFAQMPVEPEDFLALHPEFLMPPEQKASWLRTRSGAIVGRKTAEKFGWKVGDKISLRSPIYTRENGDSAWEFEICGIFDGEKKGTDTTGMYFRYDYFDEARAFAKGQVGWYEVRVSDPAAATDVARKIDEEFANSPAETRTATEGAFAQAWARQVGDIALITAAILSAVFFTILLVTGNTMSQSVRERTGEIGVLKAVGFSNGRILGLIVGESLLMAVAGGAIGLLLAWLFTSRGDPTGGLLPLFFLPVRDVVTGAWISIALGLLTGAVPAIQAMRLKVADSLRRI